MRRLRRPLLVALLALCAGPARADPTLVFDGEAPEGGPDHFFLPFQVPGGTAEIEVRHEGLTMGNVLDFGLDDPAGYRGWGGGTTEPAIVGRGAASRAYVPGPLSPGPWRVIVGKAQITARPARYHVEVLLRGAETLPPQPERRPYAPAPPLRSGRRYYAGDLHVHSLESTDARPSLGEIAAFARGRGLDFVEISDHNTVTQLDFFAAEQARQPDLLLLPGIEWTTYQGHGNAIGATRFVEHKIGQPGASAAAAAAAVHGQGALLSLNHPVLDAASLCIGCAWRHDLPPEQIDGVEIGTGGLRQGAFLFADRAVAFWDAILDRGGHAAPLGGSDDHRAGKGSGTFVSPIGSPTTMVLADELSAAAILEGIRRGRTVVKLQDPTDPMIELEAQDGAAVGDTVRARSLRLRATVRGGDGARLRLVRNGEVLAEPGDSGEVTVSGDPFVYEREIAAPASGQDRLRAEVLVEGERRTVTGHLWLAPGDGEGGCAAAGPAPGGAGLWAPALLLLPALRRRRRA